MLNFDAHGHAESRFHWEQIGLIAREDVPNGQGSSVSFRRCAHDAVTSGGLHRFSHRAAASRHAMVRSGIAANLPVEVSGDHDDDGVSGRGSLFEQSEDRLSNSFALGM